MEVLHLSDEIVFVETPLGVEKTFRKFLDRLLDEYFDGFVLFRFFVEVDGVGNDVVVFGRKRHTDAGVVGNKIWKNVNFSLKMKS